MHDELVTINERQSGLISTPHTMFCMFYFRRTVMELIN